MRAVVARITRVCRDKTGPLPRFTRHTIARSGATNVIQHRIIGAGSHGQIVIRYTTLGTTLIAATAGSTAPRPAR